MMYLFQISVPGSQWLPRSVSVLACAGVLGLMMAGAQAQPAPKLTSVSTSWVQRGTTNELVFEGENLTKATGFIFSGEPGVAATRVTGANGAVTVEASKGGIYTGDDENRTLRARVVTGADALLGVREVRVVTPAGVSNPLTVNLGFLRELAEVEPNTATNQAQWLDLPVALNGAIQEATDVDHFRFKAEKGQLLAFDLLANRIGSPLDSSLALLNSEGKELARSEDAIGFDSLIEFTVPETGEYVLQLRDFRFQGGKDYKYRLIAGAVPYLDSIFPLGGRRGQSVELSLHGRNLDGAGKMNLRITGDAPLGVQEIRARAPGGYSNPRFFEVSDSPEFIEQEPNNEPEKANVVTLPVVINGRIGAAKDVDVFKFKAEKDSTYVFEVAASRFGSSMDALLTIMSDKGEVLERNDDAAGADARIERRFGEAGDYLVSVRDLLDRGNEDFGYRLSVRPPVPDFAVKQPGDTVRVHRGSRVAVRVEVSRSAGFGGPIEVAFDHLPAGLSSSSAIIPPELGNGVLILSASADAAAGHHALRIIGTSTINGRVATRAAQPLASDRPVKESFVSILDLAPFTVELLTPSVSLEQEQSATLEAQVIRRNGFMGEIKLVADGFSAGREALTRNVDIEGGVIPAGQNRGTLRLRAKLESELGTRLMWLRGEATVDGMATAQYSRAIPLTVGQVPFTLANNLRKLSLTVLPPGSKSAAGEAELSIKAARRGWFTDQINLTVEGLPEGVVVSSANLANGVGETVFKLTATEKAPVGKEISFTILGTAMAGGRSYQQRTAPIVLTVNAATSEEGADKKQASK